MFGSKRIVGCTGLVFLLVLLISNFSPAATHNISIVDFAFQPQSDTINAGDTIRWTNNGTFPHTSTSDSGLWNSGTLSSGQSYSLRLTLVGTHPYHCAFHPSMTGTIVVRPNGPVFSPWALIGLVLLLLITGIGLLRRRRSASAAKTN